MKSNQVQREAKKTLRACLAEIPFLKTDWTLKPPGRAGVRPDLVVGLKWPGGKQTLVAEVKSSGQPRQAREAAERLLEYRAALPNSYGILLAPYISPRATEICKAEGIGYLDLAGNCLLSFGSVYIRKEGRENTLTRKRDLRSLYSPKAERILRVLLSDPKKLWKVQDIASEAGVSLGQASNVKRLLGDREWIRVGSEGFCLKESEALFKEWSKRYDYRRSVACSYYAMENPVDIENKLAKYCKKQGIEYALTRFSAAARMAPMVRYQRVTAYTSGDPAKLARGLKLKEVSSGFNVTLLAPYDEGVYYGASAIDGVRVVSPAQACLDLQDVRGRGEEATEALMQEIRRTW